MHSQHHTFQTVQILVFFCFFFKGLQHLDIRFDMDTLTNLRNIWQSNIFLFLFPTITRDSIKTTQKEIFFKVQDGKYVCANEELMPHITSTCILFIMITFT